MKFLQLSDERYALLEQVAATHGSYAGEVLNTLIDALATDATALPSEIPAATDSPAEPPAEPSTDDA